MISKIKKPVSILLVFMMIVSLFAIVPVTASAAVGDFVPETEYLTFTAEEAGSTVTLKVNSGGSNLQYDLNGTGLTAYTPGTTITLASAGDYVRFRGKDTRFGYSNHVVITGKVACSGNVMSLMLDDNGKSQGLSNYCFDSMFDGCTGLTSAPELPETDLKDGCYGYMFYGCTNLTKAPALPATNLADYCYYGMFNGCTSLTELPALPATTLAGDCYNSMFSGCSNIRISDEAGTFDGITYSAEYRIPSEGIATDAEDAVFGMFNATGGKFTGDPDINTTYYVPAPASAEPPKYADELVEITNHSSELEDLGLTDYMSDWGTRITKEEAITLAQYMSAQNDGAKCAVLYEVVDDYVLYYAMSDGTTGNRTSFYSYTLNDFLPDYKVYYVPLPAPASYTITWKNADGTTLKTDTVEEGATPTYDGETPEKAEDENYTYTFAGWSPAIAPVTENVTYTATFDATPKTPAAGASYVKVTSEPDDWSGDYLIVYEDEDGSTAFNGSSDSLNSSGNYIDVTISGGEIESNAATDAAKVTIAKINGGYSIATSNGAYIGGVSGQNKLDFRDEAILNTISLEDDSAKIVSNTSTLRFNTSWSGFRYYKTASQRPVQLYKLTGGSAPTTYTVTWKNGDTVLETDTDVAEGTTPTYDGATPEKAEDENYTYTFAGWSPAIAPVTENVTYTATFTAVPKGINYDGDNYINQNDKVTVSDSDAGKENFKLGFTEYLNMQMLGVQLKKSIATEGGEDGIRFVTAVNSKLLKGEKIKDYGYIVVKAKEGTEVNSIYSNMDKLTYDKVDENVNVFSCKGSSNTISGDFGKFDTNTDYKYVTLAITGTSGSNDTVAARFYVQTTDGEYHYADYIDGNNATHGGMAFNLASVMNGLK